MTSFSHPLNKSLFGYFRVNDENMHLVNRNLVGYYDLIQYIGDRSATLEQFYCWNEMGNYFHCVYNAFEAAYGNRKNNYTPGNDMIEFLVNHITSTISEFPTQLALFNILAVHNAKHNWLTKEEYNSLKSLFEEHFDEFINGIVSHIEEFNAMRYDRTTDKTVFSEKMFELRCITHQIIEVMQDHEDYVNEDMYQKSYFVRLAKIIEPQIANNIIMDGDFYTFTTHCSSLLEA